MLASAEFIKLCRSQLALVGSWGASLGVVYLSEEIPPKSQGKLIPIATYPESLIEWEIPPSLKILRETEFEKLPRLLSPETNLSENLTGIIFQELEGKTHSLQVVLPLLHEEVVMGFFVSGRRDRPWRKSEEIQLQQIAHTLALAQILDRRSQWIQVQFQQQKVLQAEEYNHLHSLLHQFKSPLTALRTFGKLLKKRLSLEDKNQEVASSIIRETERLQELLQHMDRRVNVVEEILTIPAKKDDESPILDLDPDGSKGQPFSHIIVPPSPTLGLLPAANFLESCQIEEILQPLLISGQAIAEERELLLKTEIPGDLPSVQGNQQALTEVLSNLIDNALKYTPKGGLVYVKTSQSNDSSESWLKIGITDTGYGIPPEDLSHLFERYYRGEKAQTDIPGTGLGLAIARDLVEQMGGKIEVFSPPSQEWIYPFLPPEYRGGTTFVINLKVEELAKIVPLMRG